MSPKKKPVSALKSEQAKLLATDEEKRRRYFMGRRDFFQEFEAMMAKPPEERKVWCVFGMGGIGKSWLLAELEGRAETKGFVTSRVDLEGIADPEDFFTALWDGFPKESTGFFGNTKKKIKNLEKAKKTRLKSEEKALTKFAKGAASVLYRAGARGTDSLAFGAGIAIESAVDVAKFVAGKMTRETDIQVERLNKEIIDALYNDLETGLKKNGFKVAIFLDTYERCSPIVTPSVLNVLECLSRSALIVITGREDMLVHHLPQGEGWEALIETRQLEELRKADIREWYEPGTDAAHAADTKAGIIEGITKGFPLLVTFVLETIGEQGIEELISADTEEVEKEQQRFFEDKIIKVLEKLDEETARSIWYAAFPRRFDGTLFSRYWEAYDRGSAADVVMKRFRSIQEYSFVQSEGKWLSCHQFIQSAVRQYLFTNQNDLWRKLNEISLDYFSKTNGIESFKEMTFHDYQLRPIESFNKFLSTYQQMEMDCEKWRLADLLLEDFSSYFAEIPIKVDAEGFLSILDGVDSLLLNYPRGDRSAICLRRISILKRAEGIVTSPEQRAHIQNSLGIAWTQLPTGDRAENIETSIRHFESALEYYDRNPLCADWAMIHNNLGNAYSDRIKGEPAYNIETSLGHFYTALQVIARETFPTEWATIQNNIGEAYRKRIEGDAAENIESAIEHFESALLVRTKAASSEKWATTHNNLGIAYSDRIKGERSKNIETAIDHLEKSLEIQTREKYPEPWAKTHNNLGATYLFRIKGDRAENIEMAIEHCEKACQVRTREAAPADWATTHNNLGEAYRKRIKGNRNDNIENAIRHFENALKVRTCEAFPIYYGQTKHNLAIVLLEDDYPLPGKERLQIALGLLEEACEVLNPSVPAQRKTFELREWVRNRLREIG